MAEDRRQMTDDRGQMLEVGMRKEKPDYSEQKSENRIEYRVTSLE